MEIKNGDRALNVVVDGDASAPPIVLLHGITSTVRTWECLVPRLIERYRTIRLDFRGHGRSDRTPGEYMLSGYLADAAAVCRQVAGEPCVVIGHSLGGITALALAQHHPELVRALVLEDPPLGIESAGSDLEGNSLMDGFRLMRASIPRLQADNIPASTLAEILTRAPSAVQTPFGELLFPDAMGAMAAGMLELDATVLDRVLDGTMEPVFDPGRPIDAPTLLLTADPSSPDAAARPPHVQRFAATSPGVDVRVMPGACHLIHDELAQRDKFIDEVLAFLDRLD